MGDYVSETPCDKPRAQLRRLGAAVFEQQYAAGRQVQRCLLEDVLQIGELVSAWRQRLVRLVAQTVRLQHGIVCGHIHCAEIRQIGNITYYNDGDWVESCTALVEEADGTMRIVHWGEEGSAPAEAHELLAQGVAA